MTRFPSQQHYTLTDRETASNTTPAVNNTSSLDTVISVGDQVTSSYDDLPPESDGPAAVVIGSRVKYGDPPLYGVVQWIGWLNNDPMAGVELVSVSNNSDVIMFGCVGRGSRLGWRWHFQWSVIFLITKGKGCICVTVRITG